jgi:hypothetical protein
MAREVNLTMAKVLYSAAMSLDGFIWMVDFRPNPVVDQLINQAGAILVGNGTDQRHAHASSDKHVVSHCPLGPGKQPA